VEVADIRLAEHFAFRSARPIAELCKAIGDGLALPEFAFDSENETEWGCVVHDGLEYNVSRPYHDGTLKQWDPSVPTDCNVGITISVANARPHPQDAQESCAELVPHVGQALADLMLVPVYHHRTWLGPGENVARADLFRPRSRGGT
jgi:hypothetical protein